MSARRRTISSRGRLLFLATAIAVGAAAACSPSQPTRSASQSSSASAGPQSATPSTPAASTSALVELVPSLPPGVIVDPGLLEVLPAEIDGVALEPDAGTAAQIGSDLLLAESTLSIAVAFAAAPGASATEDLAVASIVRLRPDVFDEAFYQEWRDTYDDAACEVADGVEAQDEIHIAGRRVYVATCVGGARTYHTYLVDQGFIVSITATGERRFGELIMAALAQ